MVDQNIVVLTRADPYIVYGGDPSTLAPIRLDFHSCVSRRSIVSGNGGVFYASPDGLCFVGPDSRAVLTEGRFNRETWNAAFARVDSRLLARQQVHRLLRYRIETGLLHPDTRPRAT